MRRIDDPIARSCGGRNPIRNGRDRSRARRARAVTAQGAAEVLVGLLRPVVRRGGTVLETDDPLRVGRRRGMERAADGEKQGLQDERIGYHRHDGGARPTGPGPFACHGPDTGLSQAQRQQRKKAVTVKGPLTRLR
jgi:hypothetical protein